MINVKEVLINQINNEGLSTIRATEQNIEVFKYGGEWLGYLQTKTPHKRYKYHYEKHQQKWIAI